MTRAHQKRILAFGAHPDDVEIYCLGTLLRLQAAGWTINWVVASDGGAGLTPGTTTATRAQEARAAGALVGVDPILFGWPDGSIDDGPTQRDHTRKAIKDFAPDFIITHDPMDYHPDHRALSRIVAAACPLGTTLVYADTMLGVGFLPEAAVDTSDTHSQKLACLSAHSSQNSIVAEEAINLWSRFRGLQHFKKSNVYAEAFRASTPYAAKGLHRLANELDGGSGQSRKSKAPVVN